tara:strand:- start:1714 stop:2115 length:402 start_codon:yes stop_codon:yes gene_type:complete
MPEKICMWSVEPPSDMADTLARIYQEGALIEALWRLRFSLENQANSNAEYWQAVISAIDHEGLSALRDLGPESFASLMKHLLLNPHESVHSHLNDALRDNDQDAIRFWSEVSTHLFLANPSQEKPPIQQVRTK